MAGMGWYGPLIDLSRASSHVGDYVQLLVFVHKSTPIQMSGLQDLEILSRLEPSNAHLYYV